MARSNFRIEKGLGIREENSNSGVDIITGTGAPPGTSGETDDAPIGSLYLQQDGDGDLYRKITDTSSAADWVKFDQSAPIVTTTAVPAATPTTVSTCLVDDCNMVEWEVFVYETGDETNRESFKLTSMHDGESAADATTFDESTHTKLKLMGIDVAGLTFTSKLAGAGASQTLGLEISATAAITVIVRRTELPAL